MQPHTRETTLSLGPALIHWRPPTPPVWQAQACLCPGPASLCLSLMPLARPRWENVAWPDGRAADSTPEAWAALPIAVLEPLLQGLCPPWLGDGEERELAALQRHLAGRSDFPGLSCSQCREQEEQGEGSPNCTACPLPRPPASARAALSLLPLLDAPPWLLKELTSRWWRGLPPVQARLMKMQLLLILRWRRSLGGAGDCPPSAGRDTF
jgi:hypothetical protein